MRWRHQLCSGSIQLRNKAQADPFAVSAAVAAAAASRYNDDAKTAQLI